MKLRRNTIGSLMLVVVIVALNLACRACDYLVEPWRLAGVGPIALAIEAGAVLLDSRSRAAPEVRILGGLRGGQHTGSLVVLICTCT